MFTVEIKKVRGKFFMFAGKAKLSCGYKTAELAMAAYKEDKELINYYANSAGVSVDNSDPVIVTI